MRCLKCDNLEKNDIESFRCYLLTCLRHYILTSTRHSPTRASVSRTELSRRGSALRSIRCPFGQSVRRLSSSTANAQKQHWQQSQIPTAAASDPDSSSRTNSGAASSVLQKTLLSQGMAQLSTHVVVVKYDGWDTTLQPKQLTRFRHVPF